MATSYTSGSIYDSLGNGRRMYVTCSQTKGSSSENKSTVNWTLTATGGTSNYYDTGPTTLNIAGVQRYYQPRKVWSTYEFPAKAGSVSGSFSIGHKTDGSIDGIAVALSTAIYTKTVSTTSGTWYMDPIARYFSNTPSITLSSKTETSMDFSWSTSEICSNVDVYYKKESETNYTSVNKYNDDNGATSGTFSLTDLIANTKYNIYIIAKRKDSGLTSNSSTSTFDTYDYPKITSIRTSSLIIGKQQSLEISNPLGRSIVIEMHKTNTDGTLLYTSPALTETFHEFTPTASTLYESIPDAQFADCVYSVICSEVNSIKTTDAHSYKITGNEKPIFTESQASTYDASAEVTEITGQTNAGGWLVQSLSKMKLTIDTAAIPQNGAGIASYKVTFNNEKQTLSVGATGGTWDALNAFGNQIATIEVMDTRGLVTSITKTIVYKPYKVPSITLTGGRQNNYGEIVDLTATYTSSSVETRNKITIAWYGAEKSGVLVSEGDAGDGSTSTSIAGVDNRTAYDFTAVIIDSFGKTANTILPISIGIPIMFVDSAQLGVGVNTFPKGQGLWVGGQGNITENLSVEGNIEGKELLINEQGNIIGNLTVGGSIKGKELLINEQGNITGNLTVGGNVKAQEIKTLRLNSTNDVANYISFARLHKTNEEERGAMTFLVSALGEFDGTIPGTCLVTFSNRDSAPTVKATWLQDNNSGDVQFGYYTSGDYYYLGIYIDTYSYSGDVILLSSDVTTGAGGPQEVKVWSADSVAPTGWTDVIPTYTGITKLDAWPVGSIYISYNATSPASLFGGTWEQIKDTFLLACGNTYAGGSTGGSTTHNHGLSAGFAALNVGSGGIQYQEKQVGAWGTNAAINIANSYNSYQTKSWGIALGGATDHTNIMPPYLAVYVWKRVEDRILITNKTFNYVNRDLGNKDIEVIEETLTINKSGLITLEEGVMGFE